MTQGREDISNRAHLGKEKPLYYIDIKHLMQELRNYTAIGRSRGAEE